MSSLVCEDESNSIAVHVDATDRDAISGDEREIE